LTADTAELSRDVTTSGPHLHGLTAVTGLTAVLTDHVADIGVRVQEAVRDRSMMLVTGVPGTGKSFASGRAVEAVLAKYPLLQAVWLEVATSLRGRALAQDLLPQITGFACSPGAPLREMRNMMTSHLAEAHRILVLDEAQHVTKEAMQLLRWLYDRSDSNFALVIVGTPELETKLAPEVRSRIMSHVHISRIADDDAAKILGSYHPLFATADPKLLAQLNRTEARGEFRWWAKFLLRAHRYLPALGGVITADAAQVICTQLRQGSRS